MYRNRRTYIAYLAAPVFILMCAAVLVLPNATLTGGKAAAQTGPTATPTPWQTDPMGSPGNYTLFRDDNLFIAGQVTYPLSDYPQQGCNPFSVDNDFYKNRSFNAKTGSSSFNGFDDASNISAAASGNWSNLRIVGGSGRVLWPGKEQGIIYKLSDFQGGDTGQATYSVELFDKTGNLYLHSFAPVNAGRYSHLDVAAGDLDRLRDANDQDQDEVVLVSESGNRTTQLTVMSFYGDGNWTVCANENGVCSFDGVVQVRYGAGGTYNYITDGTFTNSVNCSNDVFGDPVPYIGKSCDYRTSPQPMITTIDTGIPVAYFADDRANDPNNLNKGGQISVAVGDFDGDGKMEIAVATITTPGAPATSLNLSLYRYTNDGKGNAQIVLNDQQNIASAYAYADIAAGDFTGAGHDQLMVGWVGTDGNEDALIQAYDVTTDSSSGNLRSVQLSSPFTLGSSRNGYTKQCTSGVNCNPSIIQPGWVQLKAGLFKFDPNGGYGPRRRQLGVVWGNSRPVVGIAEIPTNTNTIAWLSGASAKNVDQLSGSPYCISCGNKAIVPDTREAYTMVAGNFGALNSQNPAWQLAIVAPTGSLGDEGLCDGYGQFYLNPSIAAYQYTQGNGTTDSPYTWSLQNLAAPSSTSGPDWTWTKGQYGSRGLAAVALDLDGNSLRLGAPARIVVDNLFTPDAVLQEPPKHLDWVCSPSDIKNPQKCDFSNVSRFKDFNLTYTYESSSDTSNEITSTADTSVGKSSAQSAKETVKAGVPDIASVTLSAEQKSETESDSKTSQENYSKSTTGKSFSLDTATDQADQIYYRTRTLVVYRYPLYGPPDSSNSGQQKFYDLTLPVETDIHTSPGDTSEWYQPIHENGNLLTYPYIGTDSTPNFDPSPDYGFYRVSQSGQCSVTTNLSCRLNSDCPGGETCSGALPGLLGPAAVNTFGSNSTKEGITYSASGTTGAKLTTSQTLKSSEEFKQGFKATWGLPTEAVDIGGSVSGSLQYNTSNENSWSEASVSETTTDSAKGITLEAPSISTNANYQYKTWAYITGGGFLKVAQAANVIGTDVGSWYAQTYGQWPDLSLNLPRKFLADESVTSLSGRFTLNTGIERKETKSLSISDPSIPTTDGSPAYIAGAVVVDPNASQGKSLKLHALVYNLSTAVPVPGNVNDLVARFELVPYNPSTAAEGPRKTIAEANIPAIDFYGNPATAANCTAANNPNYPVCNSVVVTADWDITRLQPGQYRLYVVLDPFEQLDEYHEWQDRRGDPLLQVAGDPDPNTPVDDNRKDNFGNTIHLEKGQNNEGWMYVNVVTPSNDTVANSTSESSQSKISLSAARFMTAEPALSGTSLSAIQSRTPELSLPENAIGVVESGNQLKFDGVTGHVNTQYRVRVQVNSDGDDHGNQHVLFYAQDPAKGGKPFAARLLRGVQKGANFLWVSFTPRQLGEQRYWARVIEHAADPKPGNNIASITVNILPPDVTPPTLEVTLTPNTLWPANGRMVPITAHITVSDDQDPQPKVRLEAITHNEANDAAGDVEGAAFGTDDRQFSLRAERNGRFDLRERVYEVVYSATDWAGNKTYAKAYVRVPLRR